MFFLFSKIKNFVMCEFWALFLLRVNIGRWVLRKHGNKRTRKKTPSLRFEENGIDCRLLRPLEHHNHQRIRDERKRKRDR